ncbi:MAG: helix-turn-helix transcriptional regulator [Paraprevotella sp.]|nr:helix-turn-helix transcriptional regulator [Paraprevotella sp.]
MEQITDKLVSTLIRQDFCMREEEEYVLESYKRYAESYVRLDNSLVIISDFRTNRSYLYAGRFGEMFGVPVPNVSINSAFEDCIFSQIHPDDLKERHLLELDYFRYQKGIPVVERNRYNTVCHVRMKDVDGVWRRVTHRTCYAASYSNGSVWLALCFYAPTAGPYTCPGIGGRVVDNTTGEVLQDRTSFRKCSFVLSRRETEVLQRIAQGRSSKDIADELHIAVYTVYRHRQNIIRKLQVANTTEAVQAALVVGLI